VSNYYKYRFTVPLLIFCVSFGLYSKNVALPQIYPLIVEKLIFFKQKNFKVFWGGFVDRTDKGVTWMMPVSFENDDHKTRAVYEISFINCGLRDAHDAEILFVDVADINIKLQNLLSPDDAVLSMLLSGKYKDGKYIVVRFADVSNVYYPDVFVASLYSEKKQSDKDDIVAFLHQEFHTRTTYQDYYNGDMIEEVMFESEDIIAYKAVLVHVACGDKVQPFYVEKRIKKDDVWKVYYIISKSDTKINWQDIDDFITVRFDSGCVSGQIYRDESCDCVEQLHECLKQVAQDESPYGIVIHMPTQDGRGFGTAPKAETEIYKRGGVGRIHTTGPLDTVQAAKLLYGVDQYDIRSFEGAAQILKSMGIKKAALFTDNIEKITVLQNSGMEVVRQKTNTNKSSCLNHIEAKRNSNFYYSE
jgi:GTP cyclohydrolase II